MKSYKLLLAFTLFLAFAFNMKAQYVHERSDQYTPPEDSLVIQKLHHWQDQKFGMLIHWGLYSVAGIVESWSICSEEADWIPRDSTMAYEDYKKWYWGLKDSFNPPVSIRSNGHKRRSQQVCAMQYLQLSTTTDSICSIRLSPIFQ